MAIIAKYKFNSSLYSDYLPTFNKEFTGYIKTDVTNSDGTITRTISHDTLKPAYVGFGTGEGVSDRERSLLEVIECDTSQVTDMNRMFQNCSSLTSLDLSSFNTSQVTNMSYMFFNCSSLTSLNLSNWNTSKVTDMGRMFENCSSLTSLDLSNFNTSNVNSYMDNMFNGCSSLTSLDLSNFNTSQVTDMRYMFNGCSSLTSLDLSNFNTSNVTAMRYMFNGCSVPNIGLLYATSSTINSLLAQLGTGVARNIYYTDAPLNELTVQNNITYKKYELTMATFPYTLNKLPNGVADYIDVVNKVHVQRVGKIVLDGSETTQTTHHSINNYITRSILLDNSISGKYYTTAGDCTYLICDKLKTINHEGFADKPYEFICVGSTNVPNYNSAIFLRLLGTSVEEFNSRFTQLAPITLLYELKTPIYTPLTEEEIAQLPLSAYADGYINLSSDQLTPSFEFRMKASNRYQVDMLETGYYYLNAPTGNVKLGTANVDVQQMPCIIKVDNVGTGDSGYRLGFSGEITDTTQITLAKLPSHRIPTSFTQGMRCATDFGYWEGIKYATGKQLYVNETNKLDFAPIELNRIEYNNTIVEDEFDIATGKLTKRVGIMTLDGSENWKQINNGNTRDDEYVYTYQIKFADMVKPNFKPVKGVISNRHPYQPSIWNFDKEGVSTGSSDVVLALHKEKAYSLEALKQYLATNPLTIYYELEVPEISYVDIPLNTLRTLDVATTLQVANQSTTSYLIPQVKPSHLTYPVPSLVGNRTYTVVHNRKNISGSTKPIELNLGGTVVQLNDTSSKTLVKTPSTLAHSNLIFIGGESTVDHIMVLDGDWTNKPIEYFENMKGHDTDAIITIIGDGKIDDVAEQYLW